LTGQDISALDLPLVVHREVGRLDVGPGQIFVTVLGVVSRLLLAVADPLAAHAAGLPGRLHMTGVATRIFLSDNEILSDLVN
jgi:hypothetical protein